MYILVEVRHGVARACPCASPRRSLPPVPAGLVRRQADAPCACTRVQTVCNDEEVRYQNFATKIRTEDMPEYEGMELDKVRVRSRCWH